MKNPNLPLTLTDELIEIDGQSIDVPQELPKGSSRRSDVQFTRFLERVVYLVGHKRLDFKTYVDQYAYRSVYALRDSRFEALLKACCNFSTWADSSWTVTL